MALLYLFLYIHTHDTLYKYNATNSLTFFLLTPLLLGLWLICNKKTCTLRQLHGNLIAPQTEQVALLSQKAKKVKVSVFI